MADSRLWFVAAIHRSIDTRPQNKQPEMSTYDPNNVPTLSRLKFNQQTVSSPTSPKSPILHPVLRKPKYKSKSMEDVLHEIEHGVMEIGLVAKLTARLLWALGFGLHWLEALVRLLIFVILLLPAFLRVAFWYATSKDVVRGVVYGKNPRNRLDIYLVKETEKRELHPVVIFISGGTHFEKH
jgi:hypothetical protein